MGHLHVFERLRCELIQFFSREIDIQPIDIQPMQVAGKEAEFDAKHLLAAGC